MAVELICPECGGVIGGRGTNAEGRGPCTCSKEDSAVGVTRDGDSSDTVSLPAPAGESEPTVTVTTESTPKPAPAAAGPAKVCFVCGKNLAGHRREGRHIVDTHDDHVVDEVWALYAHAWRTVGPRATLLEWDDHIPPFEEVHAEALKARRFQESAAEGAGAARA